MFPPVAVRAQVRNVLLGPAQATPCLAGPIFARPAARRLLGTVRLLTQAVRFIPPLTRPAQASRCRAGLFL